MDNDVLFQMVKDEMIVSDKTFYELLSQYAQSKEELDLAINRMPTLTIMVPELSNFSPASWNTNQEIPFVAVSPASNRFNDINLYNSKGEVFKIKSGNIPSDPVIVVKENERINVTVNNIDESPISARALKTKGSSNGVFLEKENMKFSFSSEAFDGLSLSKNMKSRSLNIATAKLVDSASTTNPIDPMVRKAFESNIDWHRDYIYYGLNPAEGKDKGKFNNRMVEHIVSIRMKDGEFNRISDNPVDPTVVNVPGSKGGFMANWTDGYFDIRISVLINAKNGAGTQLTKIITAKGSDLYKIEYDCGDNNGRPSQSPRSCSLKSLTPKDFYINEPLVPWNLGDYGAAWKFIVSEYDPSEEIVTTYSESTKFAANFGFDVGFGETVKLGYKFGASTETTSSSTYQYKTTKGSDELGEGVLEFGSPIILKKEIIKNPVYRPGDTPTQTTKYTINEVSCGTIYLAIEPKMR